MRISDWSSDVCSSDLGYCQLLRLPALAVGVARGDSLVFFKGVGTMGSHKDEPITADHAFPVAEVAETFTAIVLKQMEKEGKLSLEDPLSRYLNRFFNEARWDEETTLGHLVSHTSESVPHGSQFVYNDSKFNLVLNVFIGADKTVAEEIQRRILMPLNMDHTLLSYDERKHGYEMQSSVNDLVRYSVALGQNALLSATSYEQLTNPFYPGSPYGSGWFTTRFEGTVLHWSFGYDNNDAALLLRIPSSDLTFIMLVPGSVPPDLTRLG